ncbi:MAG: cytochrome c3 family protein, partial [Gemmatimonadota bacterium]
MTDRARGVKDLLWVVALAGLVAAGFRVWFGLGATTHLSDAVPWGLWKILNMVAGVALSTSGFTVGFLVYVLRLERFRPLLKPAILVAFLGYGCSLLALLFDIGLPHRFWHPFIMWNVHSFLFEVFWCVSLYFTITAIELAPTLFERFRAERVVAFLHRIAFGVVVVGISLSSLHHSSLGSLFLVTPQRLHPLWYTPLLPLLFILSAIGAGLMFLVLVRILYARWYDPEPIFGPSEARRELIVLPSADAPVAPAAMGTDLPRVMRLAAIGAGILGVYLLLQLGNLLVSGSWRALLAGTWESWLFGVEILLAAALPVALVAHPRTRGSPTGLTLAALSATAGLALNRLDVGIFGYFRDAGAVYFPSLPEWAVSAGVVAAAGLVFFVVVENFPVFGDSWRPRRMVPGRFRATWDSLSHVSQAALTGGIERVTVIAVVVFPLAWALMYPPFHQPHEPAVRPAAGLDALRADLRIDGDLGGVSAVFPHAEHQDRLGGEAGCQTCHHMALPQDEATPCSRCHRHMLSPTLVFDHTEHWRWVAQSEDRTGPRAENRTCAVCHDPGDAKSAATAVSCLECHDQDPGWTAADEASLSLAPSYLEAMHGTCVACHQEEGTRQDRGELGDCATCHPAPRARP